MPDQPIGDGDYAHCVDHVTSGVGGLLVAAGLGVWSAAAWRRMPGWLTRVRAEWWLPPLLLVLGAYLWQQGNVPGCETYRPG